MLASINPLGERSRNRTWWVTVSWYVAGSIAGGVLMGTALGALGELVDLALSPTAVAVGIVAAVLGVVALLFELHVGGIMLPTVRRQVDEDWLARYRAWVYAGGFGFQLGLGVVTVVPTATVYLTWAFAFLTGSWLGGLVIGATFGLARALPIFLVSRVRTPVQLRDAMRRFAGWAPTARRASTAVSAIVPVFAVVLVAWSTS
ncbi:MAG TPA: sulfite exporter TauE/SafE family protein [Acidimicrobiia bacterium]|nr:sulfite exporter TauE/SafE family protein [Acidimicrobiia bacterium]